MTTIEVLADRTYPVVIRDGARFDLQNYIAGATRVAILHPPTLRTAGEILRRQLFAVEAITIEVPDAEQAKSAAVVDFCWGVLGTSGFTRNDVVVSVGGGATTDLAGFVAATWLRGIRVVHVPTTLLAMVDAAVGGKTGINTPAGKNLVGAIHSPSAVLCDLSFLATQDRRDYVSGMAEIVKAGFIRDPRILELVESDVAAAARPGWEHAAEIIRRAVQVKADVVARDLREVAGDRAGREILNYGHTLGHAIERVEGYSWRHGDAVSVGMVFAAEVARAAGLANDDLVARHRTVLEGLGLPTSYDGAAWTELLAAMRLDKKTRGAVLRFIVLTDIASPDILEGPAEVVLAEAFAHISRRHA